MSAKPCGHRPGKAIVWKGEMGDRVKAAMDARTDEQFVLMGRTDSIAAHFLHLPHGKAPSELSPTHWTNR